MQRANGIVVIDTNCLRHFEDAALEKRIRRSLEAADFEIWPSAINVLEVLQDKNTARRARLLTILRRLATGRGVLPLPQDILRLSGQAIVAGRRGFRAGMSGTERMLVRDPANVDPKLQQVSQKFLANLEARLGQAHEKARPQVQRVLKERREGWESIQVFLDTFWTRIEFQDSYLTKLWKLFKLPGDAPLNALMQAPPWRLLLDAHGVAAFERDAVREQPKRVHHADLLQLVYAAAGYKRILVTEEKPLLRAATAVLVGRYPQSSVFNWAQFLDRHE
jgi:hypothetical protein